MTINRLNQGTTNQVLVKAISGQTTNLLELQDSSGSVVSSIGPTGALGGSLVPPASGLIHINTTDFSGSSATSINDVFSSDFDEYRIISNFFNSSSGRLYCRLRVSGTDNSSSNYFWSRVSLASTSTTPTIVNAGSNSLATTGFYFGNGNENNAHGGFSADIYNPFPTKNTSYISHSINIDSSTNGTFNILGGATSVTTSYTGFTIYPSSGTMTGTIKVYGYKK